MSSAAGEGRRVTYKNNGGVKTRTLSGRFHSANNNTSNISNSLTRHTSNGSGYTANPFQRLIIEREKIRKELSELESEEHPNQVRIDELKYQLAYLQTESERITAANAARAEQRGRNITTKYNERLTAYEKELYDASRKYELYLNDMRELDNFEIRDYQNPIPKVLVDYWQQLKKIKPSAAGNTITYDWILLHFNDLYAIIDERVRKYAHKQHELYEKVKHYKRMAGLEGGRRKTRGKRSTKRKTRRYNKKT